MSLKLPKVIFAFFFFAIVFLIIEFPLHTPVTDDWIFYPWQIRHVKPGNWSDLELFVGHQQILLKYLTYVGTFVPFLRVPTAGILNILFGGIGIALLVTSQSKLIASSRRNISLVAIIVVSFSFKPLYMYFMTTSLGSMLCLFLMGLYYHLKNSHNSNEWKILPIIFLSPFCFATGNIVILCELVSRIVKYLKSRESSVRNSILRAVTVSSISISISTAIPTFEKNFNLSVGGAPNSLLSGVYEAVLSPISSVKFILIAIGNIFVPSSRLDPLLPAIAGFLFLITVLLLTRCHINQKDMENILESKNCLLAGVIYIGTILVGRGVESAQGYQSAAAPRYITGTFVFIVGAIVLAASENGTRAREKVYSVFLLIIISTVLISGFKTGLEWLEVRRNQTKLLNNCIRDELVEELEVGGKCFRLGILVRNPVSDEEFSRQLKNFRKYGYQIMK